MMTRSNPEMAEIEKVANLNVLITITNEKVTVKSQVLTRSKTGAVCRPGFSCNIKRQNVAGR